MREKEREREETIRFLTQGNKIGAFCHEIFIFAIFFRDTQL
jgi:hypothetical protein